MVLYAYGKKLSLQFPVCFGNLSFLVFELLFGLPQTLLLLLLFGFLFFFNLYINNPVRFTCCECLGLV